MRRIGILLAVMCCMWLAACAGEGEQAGTNTAETEAVEYTYVPEYFGMKLYEGFDGDKFLRGEEVLSENGLFFAINSYGEERQQHVMHWKAESDAKPEKLPITFADTSGVPFVAHWTIDDEGNFYFYWCDYQETQEIYYLSKYDKNYNLIYSLNMDEMWVNKKNKTVERVVVGKEGTLYALSDKQVFIFDKKGEYEKSIDLGSIDVDNMLFYDTDRIILTYISQKGMELAELDVNTDIVGVPYKNLPQSSSRVWNGQAGKLFVNTSEVLFEYDIEKQEATEFLKWGDVNVTGDSVREIYSAENGNILVLCRDLSGDYFLPKSELVLLKRVDKSKVPVRETISIATIGPPDNYLAKAVTEFNRKNTLYHVEIRNYIDANSGWTTKTLPDALNRFHADLAGGNGADLFYLNNLDWENLAKKGALEDLTPYLNNSTQISKEDFVEAVVNAYDMSGKLYTIPRGFEISTLMGKKSLIGEQKGWTVRELIELAEKSPEALPIHGDAALSICLRWNWEAFIDAETASCSFDSPEFEELLEFVKQAQKKFTGNWDMYPGIKKNSTLLANVTIQKMTDYQMFLQMFEGEGNCIGYPTPDGKWTSMLEGREMLAISSVSKMKEGAWNFLEYFLQEECADIADFHFPSYRKNLEAEIQEAMKAEYGKDEQGNTLEKTTYSYGSFEAVIYAATKEEAESFYELLGSATRQSVDSEIWDMIYEETRPFFDGTKTASEVAEVIQNRVSLYLQENQS